MAFRPDAVPNGDVSMEPVDTSKAALKWLSPPSSSLKIYASKFRDFSSITRDEMELPDTAPLVYPGTGYAEIGKTKSVESQGG